MNKVFVVCEPTRIIEGVERSAMDLTPAAEFGSIEVLLPHSQSMLAPVPTVRLLRQKLADFCDDDYILPVGDPVLISTVAMIAGEINNGVVRFLKWDKRLHKYFVIKVDITGRAI